ncbi:hypothetical protein ACFFQW_32210 [Umezawaea endophytica]|uniref:Uncharacterized protein n=1 Tax=Umezawaea endophytica TaxID=1654476 RepID=A0A9X2VXD5_9PSEU|nr:hypothetical protein [Umezawaea endophytica]MCS7484331.1 hypothetical protein [Umezawaea endophytica]
MAEAPRSVLFAAGAAVLVVVGCLVTAYALRPPSAPEPRTGDSTSADAGLRCGTSTCRTVVTSTVGSDVVEVLAGDGGGRIRVNGPAGLSIFESTVVESGGQVDPQSLECVSAEVSVCLVRGRSGDQLLGEVLVGRTGTWTRAQARYLATGGYLALHDVDGDQVADVVAVQRPCDAAGCGKPYAQVFSFTGGKALLGCTAAVTALEDLPGWPAVAPAAADLRTCA